MLELRPITLREANDFVQSFHRHNGRTSRDGGKFAISLVQDGELAAVAIVGNPLSATYMDGVTAEVLRLCVRDEAERNACSKLYAACWRAWRAMGRTKANHVHTEDGEWGQFARGRLESNRTDKGCRSGMEKERSTKQHAHMVACDGPREITMGKS